MQNLSSYYDYYFLFVFGANNMPRRGDGGQNIVIIQASSFFPPPPPSPLPPHHLPLCLLFKDGCALVGRTPNKDERRVYRLSITEAVVWHSIWRAHAPLQ